MTSAELAQYIETERAASKAHARYRRLAEALAAIAHIQPHETHLIAILGQPADRSNLQALTRWVEANLKGIQTRDFEPLDYLYACLERHLNRY